MKRFSLFITLISLSLLIVNSQEIISTNISQYNGNLGIGTVFPQHKIEVYDTIDHGDGRYMIKLNNLSTAPYSTCGLRLAAGTDGTVGSINYTSETYADPLQDDSGSRLSLGTNGKSISMTVNSLDGYIRFATGGLSGSHPAFERARITGAGNLGIGTSTPSHKLEVLGDGSQHVLMALKNNSSSAINLYVASDLDYMHGGFTTRRSRGTLDNPQPLVENDRIGGLYSRAFFDGEYQPNASVEFYTGAGAGSGSYASSIRFLITKMGHTERTESMRIAEWGYVGIGTKAPSELLHVNGGLRIGNSVNLNSGTIRWTGSDFEGCDGSKWVSLTQSEPVSIPVLWQTAANNLFYSKGYVSIGTDVATAPLTVVNDSNSITYTGSTQIADFQRVYGDSKAQFQLYGYPDTDEVPDLVRGSVMLNAAADANDLILSASQEAGNIRFFTQDWMNPGSEKMRIAPSGYVGIGTTAPAELLDISGGIKLGNSENTNAGTLRWTGSDFEGYTGTQWKSLTETAAPVVTSPWLSNGNDLYYNTGNIGLGTSSPIHNLEIIDNHDHGDQRYMIKLHNTSTSNYSTCGIQLEAGNNGAVGNLNFSSETYNDPLQEDSGNRLNLGTNGKAIGLVVNSLDGYIRFATGGQSGSHAAFERMRVTGDGLVGIGTTAPQAKLEVADGDIYISDIEKGIIMKSPDGQCWRGTLDNTGELSFVQIDCPGEDPAPPSEEKFMVESDVKIYPNPAEDKIIIDLGDLQGSTHLKIYAETGTLLERTTIRENLFRQDLSAYPGGLYIVQIEDAAGNLLASEKLVVK